MARKAKIPERRWGWWALALLLSTAALRLLFNALELVPVHFDEAQYWGYGEAPAFGYYSKPPLVAWAIRLATDIFGETGFALRLFAPLCHLWTGWLIFAAGRRFFDARTGFWAAAGYTAAPGVTVSSALMTTDPPMMAFWALALYALARLQAPRKARAPAPDARWWLVLGAALGAGMLAKYTILAFVGGALGHALLSRAGPFVWRGPLMAAGAFLAVWAPNLVWLALNGFASLTHLAENADQGGPPFTPLGLPEFLATQAGVIGPVFLAAAGLLAWHRSLWRGDARLRLLLWLTLPLVLAMCVQALRGGANPNWAAPAWIAGSLLAAHWALGHGWRRGLALQLGIGAAAAVLIAGTSFVYAHWGTGLPRVADPWKKMRLSGPFCEAAIAAMEETGIATLLSDDRRRLAECAFLAGLAPGDLRIWNPTGRVTNQLEMAASLSAADTGPMLLILLNREGEVQAARFAEARRVAGGEFATHADRTDSYAIWAVAGFRGY